MSVVLEALHDKRKALEAQLAEVKQAIRWQESANAPLPSLTKTKSRKRRRVISPEHREKLRQMMKKRWATKKKAGAGSNGKQATRRPTQAQVKAKASAATDVESAA